MRQATGAWVAFHANSIMATSKLLEAAKLCGHGPWIVEHANAVNAVEWNWAPSVISRRNYILTKSPAERFPNVYCEYSFSIWSQSTNLSELVVLNETGKLWHNVTVHWMWTRAAEAKRRWYHGTLFLHPQSLTWNLKMMVSKRNLLFQGLIFRFHVKLPGCKNFNKRHCKPSNQTSIQDHTSILPVASLLPQDVGMVNS